MSQTYIGIIVSLIGTFVIPHLGVSIGTEQLTTTIETIVTLGGALWAFYGRYRLGGITFAGIRK